MDDDRRKELLKKLKPLEPTQISDEDGRKKITKMPRPGGFLLEEMLLGGHESNEYKERVLKPLGEQQRRRKIEENIKWLIAYGEKKSQLLKIIQSTSLSYSAKIEANRQLSLINQEMERTEKALKNAETS